MGLLQSGGHDDLSARSANLSGVRELPVHDAVGQDCLTDLDVHTQQVLLHTGELADGETRSERFPVQHLVHDLQRGPDTGAAKSLRLLGQGGREVRDLVECPYARTGRTSVAGGCAILVSLGGGETP